MPRPGTAKDSEAIASHVSRRVHYKLGMDDPRVQACELCKKREYKFIDQGLLLCPECLTLLAENDA